MSPGYRQEVFNVLLAQLLQERGVITAPENIISAGPTLARRIPDVIVSFYGLRVAIEGEVGDHPDAENKAIASARDRVRDGIAHIGIAVVYPKGLRNLEFASLKGELASAQMQVAAVTDSGETGFGAGDIDYVEECLGQGYDQLVKEDAVAKAVAILDASIERFAGLILGKPGIVGRLAEVLQIRELPKQDESSEEDEIE